MSDIGFELNYTNLYLINTTPEAEEPSWARLGQGVATMDFNDSDTTEDAAYYDGDGLSDTVVTGGSAGYSASGDRCYGNAAQDYIAGLRFERGQKRVTDFKHIEPDGGAITGKVTITNIVSGGGDANDKGAFGCDLTWNSGVAYEQPHYEEAPSELSVQAVSVTVGGTAQVAVTATPAQTSDACAYASSDTSIATVDDAGNVKGVQAGTCQISVKSIVRPSVKAVATVTVTAG